jgi:hypothetical protein
VHLLCHSLDFVSWKDRKPVAAALKDIYRAVDAASGEVALTAFEEGVWGRKYSAIGQSWQRAWGEVVPFYAFPGDVRRILYTTDEIDKPFRRYLLSCDRTGDRVAKSWDRGRKPGRAAFSVAPHLRHPCAASSCRTAATG